MMHSHIQNATWALAQLAQAAGSDQTPAQRGWFEQMTGIASGLMTLTLLVMAAFLIPAAWNFRKSYKKANALLDRISADINPIIRHASSIADNVDYVTTMIRADAQRLNATVVAANQRVHQAVELTEHRLQEFNALLAVVQEEAEQLFISTASTVRGVRQGAASFRQDGPGLASMDDAAGLAGGADTAEEEESDDDNGFVDGNERDGEGGDRGELAPETPAPRIRPRGGAGLGRGG